MISSNWRIQNGMHHRTILSKSGLNCHIKAYDIAFSTLTAQENGKEWRGGAPNGAIDNVITQ
jgi:hypothetical protein